MHRKFPTDLNCHVLSFLSSDTLRNNKIVSKEFYHLCSKPLLWKNLLKTEYEIPHHKEIKNPENYHAKLTKQIILIMRSDIKMFIASRCAPYIGERMCSAFFHSEEEFDREFNQFKIQHPEFEIDLNKIIQQVIIEFYNNKECKLTILPTLLFNACFNLNINIVRQLIELGFDVNTKLNYPALPKYEYVTPLLVVLKVIADLHGDTVLKMKANHLIQLLLDNGADPDIPVSRFISEDDDSDDEDISIKMDGSANTSQFSPRELCENLKYDYESNVPKEILNLIIDAPRKHAMPKI